MKSGKVYGLINPKTNKIFYVGCTQLPLKRRLLSHISTGKLMLKNTPTTNYINGLFNDGFPPTIELLETVRTPNKKNKSINDAERIWINVLLKRGVELVNKNNVRI